MPVTKPRSNAQKYADLLERLIWRGFDRSTLSRSDEFPFAYDGVRVGCSQCQATGINGVACHESGCMNEKHECKGCNTLVARGVRYCEDCI